MVAMFVSRPLQDCGRSCNHCELQASNHSAYSFDRWWLRSPFHRQDLSYPCVNPRVAITYWLFAEPLSHLRLTFTGHPEVVGGKAMPAWSCLYLVGEIHLWHICTYYICHASLERSKLPVSCKPAIFRPLLKKHSLGPKTKPGPFNLENLNFRSNFF